MSWATNRRSPSRSIIADRGPGLNHRMNGNENHTAMNRKGTPMAETKPGEPIHGLPLGRGVRVLAQDPNGLVALEKPVNVLSHPNARTDRNRALLDADYSLKDESYTWEAAGEKRCFRLLNRLDSATSGVVLGTWNPDVAAAVRREFATGRVGKTYLALVFGAPRPPRQRWTDLLEVERSGSHLRTRGGGRQKAEATVHLRETVAGPPRLSLIELTPKTGRTHQLRVQCARRKLPIVGDKTYGDFRGNREFSRRTGEKRLFLHSAATALSYLIGGRKFEFRAESTLPPGFRIG